MACNCTTQEEIDKLYRQFGEKTKISPNAKLGEYIKYYVGNTLVYLLGAVCFPLLVIYILFLLFWREDEKIHVNDVNLLKKLKIVK